MAERSKISWTDSTFNPWSGCTKVSAECEHCYAAVDYSVKVRGVKWGQNGNRIVKAESGWKDPLKWNREAEKTGQRRRVFCASLADVFEDWNGLMLDADMVPLHHGKSWCRDQRWVPVSLKIGKSLITMHDVRRRLFETIDETPNLDWLLLTKRPESVLRMWPRHIDAGDNPELWSVGLGDKDNGSLPRHLKNVWVGTSVGVRKTLGRIDAIRNFEYAAVRFLSIEPLLEDLGEIDLTGIDWVIVGGESGHGARPCNIAWIRSMVDQCRAAGVSCFVKQLGAFPVTGDGVPCYTINDKVKLKDKKGGDPEEWDADLRVREFPRAEALA